MIDVEHKRALKRAQQARYRAKAGVKGREKESTYFKAYYTKNKSTILAKAKAMREKGKADGKDEETHQP